MKTYIKHINLSLKVKRKSLKNIITQDLFKNIKTT